MFSAPTAFDLPVPPRGRPWGIGLSLLVHVLALVAVLLVAQPDRRNAPPEPESIAVELISAADFAALTQPAPAPVLATPPAQTPAAPVAPLATPDAGPIEATRFFASAILRSDRKIAAALDSVSFEERITQLCNIEGLEQIRVAALGYAADTLVPYAMAQTRIADHVLTAPGGAFRSRRQWFAIAFTCTVAADLGHVQAFSFSVGAPIPRELWDAHFLTEEDADE